MRQAPARIDPGSCNLTPLSLYHWFGGEMKGGSVQLGSFRARALISDYSIDMILEEVLS